jgi:hypothetical protein
MNYIHDAHQINDINFTLEYSFKKHIYDNHNIYEPSLIFLLELDEYLENVILTIHYKENVIEIYLEQLNITDHKISAMTLFKDDYPLLKKYLEYYQNLGVNLFYIYYNKEIDHKIIEYITNISNGLHIYLIEWDYVYWWKYNKTINHHHAQTMAINDALHILKNYSQYLLYNDLDEYFLFGKYIHINDMIEENKDVDIFIFKNRFCKIGDTLIKYEDFYEKFDLTKIIEGNYWDKGREKNMIKLENINIMGIHSTYDLKSFKELIVNQFYHIINFEEKYRENLMTQYIG